MDVQVEDSICWVEYEDWKLLWLQLLKKFEFAWRKFVAESYWRKFDLKKEKNCCVLKLKLIRIVAATSEVEELLKINFWSCWRWISEIAGESLKLKKFEKINFWSGWVAEKEFLKLIVLRSKIWSGGAEIDFLFEVLKVVLLQVAEAQGFNLGVVFLEVWSWSFNAEVFYFQSQLHSPAIYRNFLF